MVTKAPCLVTIASVAALVFMLLLSMDFQSVYCTAGELLGTGGKEIGESHQDSAPAPDSSLIGWQGQLSPMMIAVSQLVCSWRARQLCEPTSLHSARPFYRVMTVSNFVCPLLSACMCRFVRPPASIYKGTRN